MNLRRFQTFIVSLGICACTGSASGPADISPEPGSPAKVSLSDAEVIALAYDNFYTVPDGFFVDERASTPQSYSLYHVKDESASFELCTDDFDEALAWEEADNASRAVTGYYVDAVENEQYFEVVRELSFPDDVGNVPGITSPGFARIFKCSNVNRDGVDRNLYDGFGGKLNRTPLNPGAVREFTEYLWQFAFFATNRRKVLESYSSESADSFDHTLLLAFVINQGFEQCDRIEMVEWTYSADKSTGNIDRQFAFVRAIEAQLVDGIPEQCSAP